MMWLGQPEIIWNNNGWLTVSWFGWWIPLEFVRVLDSKPTPFATSPIFFKPQTWFCWSPILTKRFCLPPRPPGPQTWAAKRQGLHPESELSICASRRDLSRVGRGHSKRFLRDEDLQHQGVVVVSRGSSGQRRLISPAQPPRQYNRHG